MLGSRRHLAVVHHLRDYDGRVSTLPVLQLGQLISQLLPQNGFHSLDWNYLSNQKDLLSRSENLNVTEGGEVCRQALARVEIRKTQAKFLLQQWTELPWSALLQSNKSKGPHPDYVEITPGGENSATRCFGGKFSGCTVDIREVLASAPFRSYAICSPPTLGGVTKVFKIAAPGRPSELLVYNESGGSGGASDWLDIRSPGDMAQVCQPTN